MGSWHMWGVQLAKLTTASNEGASVTQSPASNRDTITNIPTYAATVKQGDNSAIYAGSRVHQSIAPASDASTNIVHKKFNIVMYGLNEPPKGSPRHECLSSDTNSACTIIKSICPEMNDHTICDCSRIGKYSEDRTRPLIVRFARSCDVATILSSRHKISRSEHPHVFLKPYMTITERKTESTLLKERRVLIDSGVERKLIKIRGNSIYINKTKVGSANEATFTRLLQRNISESDQQVQPHVIDPSPTRQDTTNVPSASVTNSDTNTMPTNDEEPSQKPQAGESLAHGCTAKSTHSN